MHVCMHACMYCGYSSCMLMPIEAKRGSQIPGSSGDRWLSHLRWRWKLSSKGSWRMGHTLQAYLFAHLVNSSAILILSSYLVFWSRDSAVLINDLCGIIWVIDDSFSLLSERIHQWTCQSLGSLIPRENLQLLLSSDCSLLASLGLIFVCLFV